MSERPPEFTDIDLDEEDDEAQPKPPDQAEDEDEPLDPIDFDDEDEDEDDESDADADVVGEDGAAGPAEDADLDNGVPRSSAAPVDYEEEEEDERPPVERDGVQRAAAVLKYIVENIVDEPDQIAIGATMDDRGPVLLLRVADDDRGKVIGRQGRIVQAIRTVVKAATVGTGEKVSVEIID